MFDLTKHHFVRDLGREEAVSGKAEDDALEKGMDTVPGLRCDANLLRHRTKSGDVVVETDAPVVEESMERVALVLVGALC